MVRYGVAVQSPTFEADKETGKKEGVRFFAGERGASIAEANLSAIYHIRKNDYDDILGDDFLSHFEDLSNDSLEKEEGSFQDIDEWNNYLKDFGISIFEMKN